MSYLAYQSEERILGEKHEGKGYFLFFCYLPKSLQKQKSLYS